MSKLSKQALKVDNNTSFPNNNTGYITPTILRTYNDNIIDSMVDEIPYGEYTSSVDNSLSALNAFTASASGLNTGSLLITASAASNVITFTKGDASQFSVTVADTTNLTPLNQFTASAQISITALNASSASQQISIDNLNLATASLNTETASIETRFATIATQSGSWGTGQVSSASFNSFTASVNAFTASTAISLTNLNAFSASQLTKDATLQTYTASVNTSISNLNLATASLNTSVTNLNTFSASQLTQNSTLATYTGSNDTKWSNLGAQSGSWITESETGSFAYINKDNAWSANQTFTNITAVSASFQYVQTTYETSSVIYSSGSNQFGDASNDVQTLYGSTRVMNELTASGLNYPTADGTYSGQVLQTNAAGTLSFGNVNAMYQTVRNGEATSLTVGTAVYVSGSQGANPIVYRADSSNASKMPVQYIISETIASNGTGRALLLGVLEGYNVGAAAAGTQYYVDGNGTLTTTRPTGSADTIQPIAIVTKTGAGGQLSVLNPGPVLLPNIQTGYLWVGNGNNQPISVATSSIITSINTGSLATTGSNAFFGTNSFSGAVSFTGSAPTILSSSFSGSIITNLTDIYTDVPPVNQIVTLTSASYAALVAGGTLNPNTLYVVSGSTSTLPTDLGPLNQFSASINAYTASNDQKWNDLQPISGTLLQTASFSSNTLAFTKLNGGPMNIAGIASTGSNVFTGNQTISGSAPRLLFQSGSVVDYIGQTALGNLELAVNGTQVVLLEQNTATIQKPTTINGATSIFGNTQIIKADVAVDIMKNTNYSGSAYNIITNYVDTTTDIANVYSSYGLIGANNGVNYSSFAISSYSPEYPNVATGMIIGGGATNGSDTAIGFPTNQGIDLWKTTTARRGFSVSGSLAVTGSASGNVVSASITSNTASIDFSKGNYFEVTSSVTPLHLNITNIKPGTTSTLIVSASASSSILFSPNVAQPSGSAYSGSAGSIDILSLVAFNTSKVNVVSTKALV